MFRQYFTDVQEYFSGNRIENERLIEWLIRKSEHDHRRTR